MITANMPGATLLVEPEDGLLQARPAELPTRLPQPTFEEAREASISISAGQTGRWKEVEQLPALSFQSGEKAMLVQFEHPVHSEWSQLPARRAELLEHVKSFGVKATLLFMVVVSRLVEGGEFEVSIDKLIEEIGFDPRSTDERQDMRRQVWRWLQAFAQIKVIGQRKRQYHDRSLRKWITVESHDSLMRLGRQWKEEASARGFFGDTPPLEVKIEPGDFIKEYQGNRGVLASFGDVGLIASLRGGQTSRLWAQVIGLTLNQRWREQATHDKQFIFTRRQLFSLLSLPEAKSIEALLASSDAWRARDYWDEAIEHLKSLGIIDKYRVLSETKPGWGKWKEAWLDEVIEIKPKEKEIKVLDEVKTKSDEAWEKTQKRASKGPRRLKTAEN